MSNLVGSRYYSNYIPRFHLPGKLLGTSYRELHNCNIYLYIFRYIYIYKLNEFS